MNYYDLDCCPFCDNYDLKVMPNSCIVCDKCVHSYQILKFADKTFSAGFYIGSYKFSVTDKETLIIDMTFGKKTYDTNRLDYSFFITKGNHLDIIKRIKTLQPFY